MDAYFFQGVFRDENTLLKALFFGGKEITYQSWYGVDPSTLELNRTYNPAGEIYDENGNQHPTVPNEIATGLIDLGHNYISRMTLGVLKDIGYI